MLRASLRCLNQKVLYQDFPRARLVTLNNVKAHNALNMEMLERLMDLYMRHPAPETSIYVLKGAGNKAFCAGGDVVNLTTDKTYKTAQRFYYEEYQLNYHLMTMKSAQVALWNGYVLGGGVGISLPSRYRVATEKTLFGMPETAIGLIPDVGGTWFLPRLKHAGVGLYMGLTGHKLKGADVMHAGLATHFVPSAKIPEIEKALCEIRDASTVGALLDSYNVKDLPPYSLERDLPFFAKTFRKDTTMEAIMEAVTAERAADEIVEEAHRLMSSYSPTSLKLALEAYRRGCDMTDPKDAFALEYMMALRLAKDGDFVEGVRALLVDKDKKPQWSPKTLAEVTPASLETFFKPTFANQVAWDPVKPFPE
ncbi:3-hydroxyisobutyryl-coenzyme a hydrolase [Strigomonas culicis]|uniref:3-hydroxyisobutyryl-CoA hydrolase n=1 Tax=Strigomonas culicis TaxID=28005 RepID=S9UT61_9TRYP|nr:3-hydroxyisobutyryl-coenzyme a hydrolase [Strigomonas culicis]EPY35813.1 3-hydroxyisobutyryl-coenzyme a hydrolase [Strigomonas culicis]|eukprot:EPY32068.1 3-hydroxyisobutyryl-coenzyme a hydrolase [Strigomonas culicis]